MEILAAIAQWILNKDPLLAGCILFLGFLNYKTNRALARTDGKITHHLDPQNKYPHPECEWGEKNYIMLKESLEKQHEENREDHQEIFRYLRGEKK